MRRHDLLVCALVGLAWMGLHAPSTGQAQPGTACESNADCDDRLFCNGEERCRVGRCEAGEEPCLDDQRCDEDSLRCIHDCGVAPDGDGDGVASIDCGGSDCDDSDPNRFPGNVEVCDEDGHDEDCDPRTFGTRDSDGDGHIDMRCKNYR